VSVLTALQPFELFSGRCRQWMALLHQDVGQPHPMDLATTTLGSKMLIRCDAQNANDSWPHAWPRTNSKNWKRKRPKPTTKSSSMLRLNSPNSSEPGLAVSTCLPRVCVHFKPPPLKTNRVQNINGWPGTPFGSRLLVLSTGSTSQT
jgi:hypothetical protein